MKHLLQAVGILSFCTLLAGCGTDSHQGHISDTISMMNQAATETENIKNAVAAAIKEVEEGKSNKLNLTAAMKAADKLKETGDKTLETKARIEMVRLQITDEEKRTNAANNESQLNTAFTGLQTKKDALRKTLAAAELVNISNAKDAVQKLREKLVIAESPFEALTR